MEEFTKKHEQISELIGKHKQNITNNHQELSFNVAKILQLEGYLKKLEEIEPNSFIMKYGSKYKLFKKLNLLIYILIIIISSILNIPLALSIFTGGILWLQGKKITETLKPYYEVFGNKKVTIEQFLEILNNTIEKRSIIITRGQEIIEEIKLEQTQIEQLETIRRQLETETSSISLENSIEITEPLYEERPHILTKKHPQI